MTYIVRATDPEGARFYVPERYGHGVHALAQDKAEAARYDNEGKAGNVLRSIRYPAAFWEGERRHRDAVEKKYRGWAWEVVKEEDA